MHSSTLTYESSAETFAKPETFQISGPGLTLTFSLSDGRLALAQMQREDGKTLLHCEAEDELAHSGAVGNPLAVIVRRGPGMGQRFGLEAFRITGMSRGERRLLAYFDHETLPLQFALEVSVEGHVASWRGQAGWNGDETWEADFYLPLFSRIVFDHAETDRAILPANSGSVFSGLNGRAVCRTYIGNFASPVMLAEGGGRGLALLDDNLADYAAEPGACVQRAFCAGSFFPPALEGEERLAGEEDLGPFVGVRHTRRFRAVSELGLTDDDMTAENWSRTHEAPMELRGDAADFGPIRTYAYHGSWKAGALWLRERRAHVALRRSPAQWWRNTTFVSEDMGDAMVRRNQSFHDYPTLLENKRAIGSDVFHLPGFHDAEMLGDTHNWQNRGDYHYAAENLGGPSAARAGVDAVHRAGGRVFYYVEGLILWKRSRIGKSRGRDWALLQEDGTPYEHYKGFWHPCPACPEWADWLAESCADIVRSLGVDGFFIDSIGATDYHRCFNPAHNHPHPDIWTWGVRDLLRRVRAAVDRVNPETVLLIEGAADLAREFVDGSLSHTHDWSKDSFGVPLLRFLHPEMRVFESWGDSPAKSPRARHIWNAVHGHRIYAHEPARAQMGDLARRTRRYFDSFPEITEAPMSVADIEVSSPGAIAALFESLPPVVTVGSTSGAACEIDLTLPLGMAAGVLFDRVTGDRVPVHAGTARVALEGHDFRAYEVRV
ncbi:hypothetical protein CCAX7_25350 [Capsulimonas corticalis]|uniref:DUF6259 domain-containing protein n=1 Tax=Capsulimonas corticalis TaxID=2219043 RepID=A0A402CVP8_9BACT|nr:DUF6259 domain-containing protein [Capsulimonas corticalis]BDI30484.1 hypothetical protein CCAX7_25350 [Capsulimonas corticalis]